MIEYNGTPFSYNPAVTNINIDNQLSGILSQFDDDYIMGVIDDSLQNRFRIYDLPAPNIVAAFENNFKTIKDGFSTYTDDISETRERVYKNIIAKICKFYDLEFQDSDEMDYYSAAYWLYELLVSNFTQNLINFYVSYIIKERKSLSTALNLSQLRKDSDTTLMYSKNLFKDQELASIHCNLGYVLDQMSTFDIDLWTILTLVYQSNETLPGYIYGLIRDCGNFFRNHYETFAVNSKNSADVLTYMKLGLQQAGGQIEPEA